MIIIKWLNDYNKAKGEGDNLEKKMHFLLIFNF
jgi:hypothetical protein